MFSNTYNVSRSHIKHDYISNYTQNNVQSEANIHKSQLINFHIYYMKLEPCIQSFKFIFTIFKKDNHIHTFITHPLSSLSTKGL